MCEAKDCKRVPTFNFDGEKNARFCFDHKEINMIDIIHKRRVLNHIKKFMIWMI
jgi:hypothetical protein